MEYTLLPTIGNNYYYCYTILFLLCIIYRHLGNNHFIQLLWVFFIHLKLEITSATLGSNFF